MQDQSVFPDTCWKAKEVKFSKYNSSDLWNGFWCVNFRSTLIYLCGLSIPLLPLVPCLWMVQNYLNYHCFFFFFFCLLFYGVSFVGEKSTGRKNPHPSWNILKSWSFWGLAWAKRKIRKNDLDMWKWPLNRSTILFMRAKPSTMMNLWNHASQPTATRWKWSRSKCKRPGWWFPRWLGPQIPLLHGVQQAAPSVGRWGKVCVPF